MATRKQNESRYDNWVDLADGGRRYWYDVAGKQRGFARYIKIVDADENTLQFVQEIYNDDGKLIEIHQKYPLDTDHQKINSADGSD